MVDSVQFKIEGLEELLGKLASVTDDVKRKGGRSALRKAAQLIANKAKENAKRLDDPESANDISKNIVARWNGKLNKSTGDLGFRVGVRGGAKLQKNYYTRRGRTAREYHVGGDDANPGGNTFYWRFLEFGTKHMPAQPFMRSALADNISEATRTFVTAYTKAIERAIKRARKKSAQGA